MIGCIRLDSKVILAPMADVTDLPFRLLCKTYGASMVYTPMISVEAILRNNKTAISMLKSDRREKPVGVQLFGCKPELFVKAVMKTAMLLEQFDLIDINAGCPTSKVIKQGAGAALLNTPEKLKQIAHSLVKCQKKPVTVKLRVGIANEINIVPIVKMLEKAGVSAVTIHPRTVAQGYKGVSNWGIIKKVKEAVNICVIGNGDVRDGSDAEKMLSTGCDYIMVGRSAIGNPFVFRQISKHIGKIEWQNPTKAERLESFLKYCDFANSVGEKKLLKQQSLHFCRNFHGSARMRERLSKADSEQQIISIIKEEIYREKMEN